MVYSPVKSMSAGLLAAFFVLLTPTTAALQITPDASAWLFPDYLIEGYKIDCEIDQEGTLQVVETIDLKFSEELDSIQFQLTKGDATAVTLKSVTIGEADSNEQTASMIEVMPAESTDQAGSGTLCYTLSATEEALGLNINSLNNADTARRFVITYAISGALFKMDDGIVLRHPFFGALGSQTITEPILMIRFPDFVQLSDAWLQSISAEVFLTALVDSNTVQMSAIELPANHSFEAAVVAPASLLPSSFAARTEAGNGQSYIKTYQSEQDRLTRERITDRLAWALAIVLAIASLILYIGLVLLLDLEGRLQLRNSLPPQFTTSLRPALLASIFRRHHPGQLLLSTLTDLVLRGHLKLDGHVFSINDQRPGDYRGMAAYEIFLIQWLYERVTQEKTLSTAQIRKYALDSHLAAEFSAYYSQFINLIQDELNQVGLADPIKKQKCRRIGISLGTGYSVVAGLMAIFIRTPAALLIMVSAGLFFYYGLRSRHLSSEGYHQANIARVYRHSLKQYDRLCTPDYRTAKSLAQQLPSAVALGVCPLYLEQVLILTTQRPEVLSEFLSLFSQSMIAADPLSQMKDLSRDLSVMDSMLSASLYLALGFHYPS